MVTIVLYEGTPGVRVRRAGLAVVGVEPADLVEAALEHAGGADRLELCGGVGAGAAAQVRAAVGSVCRVGLNRYGFESLELIAAYKAAFAAGEARPAAFLFPADGPADVDPVEHEDGTFQPVVSLEHAAALGERLASAGVGMVELYAGLATEYAAAVVRGSGGSVPVGFVGYDD